MKISYYLNESKVSNKNLYCRISDGAEKVTFSLEHTVDRKEWNAKKGEVKYGDVYYFTLDDFKKYLTDRYDELKAEGKENIATILKNEALAIMNGLGMEGFARQMFDLKNEKDGVPKYDDFLRAFEKYSKLKREDYKAQTIDSKIHFYTDDEEYEMDTYEGKTAFLKSIIENRSYEDIYIMTDARIWGEIYIDAGIEKHVFLPQMQREWELYWSETYTDIKETVGRTDHLDEGKEESWRQLQIYMGCYDDAGDVIKLALDIDEDNLYPIAVITMMQIFDADTCYGEYCEWEFDSCIKWESVSLGDDEDADGPVFFIKPYKI